MRRGRKEGDDRWERDGIRLGLVHACLRLIVVMERLSSCAEQLSEGANCLISRVDPDGMTGGEGRGRFEERA